jgi:hypothetical protein
VLAVPGSFKSAQGRLKLGADKDEGFRHYHQLMAAPQETPAVRSPSKLIVVVVDPFRNIHRPTSPIGMRKDRQRRHILCRSMRTIL